MYWNIIHAMLLFPLSADCSCIFDKNLGARTVNECRCSMSYWDQWPIIYQNIYKYMKYSAEFAYGHGYSLIVYMVVKK